MESLSSLKKLLQMVGQYPLNEKNRLWYKVYGFFACSSMWILLVPTIYLATTLNRVDQFASIIPVGVGCWNGTFKGTFFLIYNKEVRSLLANIQETFNAQLLKKRPDKHYNAVNSSSDYLVNGFRWVMGICGWAPIIGPPSYALFHYILGTLTDDKIKTPIPALLPYDITSLPSYVATCIAYAVTINFWVFSIAAIDTFYLSSCVAFNGFFNDLMDMFAETDQLVDQIERFQHLYGPIIFAQYFFSLSQLGTLVFATVMIPGITPDVVIFNITLMVACLTELLIYCYFGSELTSGAKKVSNAIYSCKWYKYHPKLRKYLVVSMTRAQKGIRMHGFYMVIASMETFSLLINMVASAFTLLKSTVGQ